MPSEDQETEDNNVSQRAIAKEITCISLFLFFSSFIGAAIGIVCYKLVEDHYGIWGSVFGLLAGTLEGLSI